MIVLKLKSNNKTYYAKVTQVAVNKSIEKDANKKYEVESEKTIHSDTNSCVSY